MIEDKIIASRFSRAEYDGIFIVDDVACKIVTVCQNSGFYEWICVTAELGRVNCCKICTKTGDESSEEEK